RTLRCGAQAAAPPRPRVFCKRSELSGGGTASMPIREKGRREDYVRIFGGSGRTGPTVSKNCAVVACQSSMQRSPPVHRRDSGACQDTRRSNRPCATTLSTYSICPDSMSLPESNPVEPPWYGPVCPVVWEGWHREVSPYPDPRRIAAVRMNVIWDQSERQAAALPPLR